jgi:hypothetical protein
LENVSFSSNSAGEKGGGMSTWGSSPTLTDVTFNGNKVIGAGVGSGGGMFIYGNSPILTNVTFTGNSTDATGGGMYNLNSSPVLINVTFSGNSAVYGGGINDLNSSPALLNVTLKTNSASYRGGGMYHRDGNPTIINAIFWGNTAPSGGAQIYNYSGTPSLYDSVVQGGYPGGTHIIITDPMLGMLGNYGGFTQTIPVLEGSSAIDTGNDTFCPDTDQRGAPRPLGAHCDIGAFEYYPFRIFLPLVFR